MRACKKHTYFIITNTVKGNSTKQREYRGWASIENRLERRSWGRTSLRVHVARAQCKVDLFFKQAHLERPFERRMLFTRNSENDPVEDILEPCAFASNEFGPERRNHVNRILAGAPTAKSTKNDGAIAPLFENSETTSHPFPHEAADLCVDDGALPR